jgi:hypothetical protein
MKTNRTGITRLTTGQCSRVAGGDPGMVLVGLGNGGGGGGPGMALAGMGIGYEGGPMAVVTIGLPDPAPFTDFDKAIIGSAGSAAGYATSAFVAGIAEGALLGTALGPAGWVAGAVIGGLVAYGAAQLIQHGNNETRYAGKVRHVLP